MDIASLQLEIDSRSAKEAKKSLEGLTSAAERAESATDSLSQANAENEDRYKAIARAAIERQTALSEEVRAQMRANAAISESSDNWKEQANTYTRVASAEHQLRMAQEKEAQAMADAARAAEENQGALQKLLGQIDPLEGKLNRLDEMEMQLHNTFRRGAVDAETYSVALAKIAARRQAISDQQLKQIAAGAQEAAQSMKGLGLNTAQAQRDLITLGRAAASGNWTQVSSSALQLGRTTGALSLAFSAAGVATMGLVGGLGLLAAAYFKGQREAQAYNQALILTGNYAGVTSGQLAGMANRIGDLTGSVSDAAQALTLIAGSGKIAGENMELIGEAAISMAKVTGRSVQEIVGEFEGLGREPAKALVSLNDKYHFLTAAVYEQVSALAEQGREQEAVSLAERIYAGEMQSRANSIKSNLGALERAWAAVAGAASGAWDAMLDVGREATLQDEIGQARKRVAALENTIATGGAGMQGQGRDYGPIAKKLAEESLYRETQKLHLLENQADIEAWAAGERAKAQADEEASIENRIKLDARHDQYLDKELKKSKEIAEVQKEILEANRAGNPYSQEKIDTIMAGIEEKYADKSTGGGSTKARIDAGQQLIKQMQERIALIGAETEYEQLLARIGVGSAQFRTQADQAQALALAQTIDVMTEAEEQARAYQDLMANLYPESVAADEFINNVSLLHGALEYGILTIDQYNDALGRLSEDDYWGSYLTAAEERLLDFNELAGEVINNFSSQFGNAFESMVFDAKNLGDAVSGMAEGMARSIVNALGQMAAQWLAYQAVQLLVGKSGQAAGAAALSANAQAAALQSGIAAYASTAAIPIIGPALAPAAMATALATTTPLAAAVGTAALAGMAHDGIDSVPETGTWLLKKGERVVTSETSARLDATLDRLNSNIPAGQERGNTTVNLIEDKGRAGEVNTRYEDKQQIIDIFVADIRGGGRSSEAFEQTYGMQRVGA